MTGEAEADTWMRMSKYSSTDGGGAIVGYSDSDILTTIEGWRMVSYLACYMYFYCGSLLLMVRKIA